MKTINDTAVPCSEPTAGVSAGHTLSPITALAGTCHCQNSYWEGRSPLRKSHRIPTGGEGAPTEFLSGLLVFSAILLSFDL